MREPWRTRVKLALGRGVAKSYSQFGEDAVVGALLRAPTGTYVDVGTYDPVLYSNTYALYGRGWKGLVIDPNAALAPRYKSLRPRDTFVASAITRENDTLPYYRYSDGAYNTLSEARMRELTEKGMRPQEISPVPARPLAAILAEHEVGTIDFLNIDVEGLDLAVLESNDWSRYPPRVIAIEDHAFSAAEPGASATYRYLSERGYALAAFTGVTLIFAKGV